MKATWHCWERHKAAGSNPLSVRLWNTAKPLQGCADDQTQQHVPLGSGESIKFGKIIIFSSSVIDQDCLCTRWEASGLHYLLLCWLRTKVLIKIKFLTATSVACLQWNSVLGNCQKTQDPASQHLHISKFLLQNILFPKCPGSRGREGTEKA